MRAHPHLTLVARGQASGGLPRPDRVHALRGERNSEFLSVGAALKLAQVSQALIDVIAVVFGAAFILVTAVSFVAAPIMLFCGAF